MLIFWINRKIIEGGTGPETREQAFRRHDETMKSFRRAHPDLNIVNARDIVLADGNLLAPLHGMSPDANTQN